MLLVPRWRLSLVLAGLLLVHANATGAEPQMTNSAVFSDDGVSQMPKQEHGGYLSSAENRELSGGWTNIYRAADDFVLTKAATVRKVTWWGGCSSGNHRKVDTIDHVLAFSIEVFNATESDRVGERVHRSVIPFEKTNAERSRFRLFAGSDVLRHTVTLPQPIELEKGKRYWLCIAAYVSRPPMWVWYNAEKANGQAAIDMDANGSWDDQPESGVWTRQKDLAFRIETRIETETSSNGIRAELPLKNIEPSNEEIQRLINQLTDDKYEVREAAEQALVDLGEGSIPLLMANVKADDPDFRHRIKRALLRLGKSAAPRDPFKIHTVSKGESLLQIAQRNGISVEKLKGSNALPDNKIRAGEMLLLWKNKK